MKQKQYELHNQNLWPSQLWNWWKRKLWSIYSINAMLTDWSL